MSATKPSLLEKMTQLAAHAPDSARSAAEASTILEGWRHEYPDTDKFISRRFTRLPVQAQKMLLHLLQQAEASAFANDLQEWSRNHTLSLAVRSQALGVLETLGEPVDTAYRDQLLQAREHLSSIRANPSAVPPDTEALPPSYREAVLHLPLAVALDLCRELAAEQPVTAVAMLRALQSVVDAHDYGDLVESLANIPVSESAVMLQDLLAETSDKALNKSIKKALHRLKAQGVRIAESQQPRRTVVVGSVTHHLEKCLASHIDAVGDRVLWMIRTKSLGGYQIAYLVINYGTGIRVAHGLQASKRELPDLLSKAQEQVRLIDLEPSYCQHQVALAHQMNLETRTPVPETFFALREIIGEADTPYEQSIIYTVLSEADLQEAAAYAEYAEDLLEIPEFAGWSLPSHIVQKYADQLRDIEESQIVVSPALQRERTLEIYAQAAEEALSERSRRIMRLRLEEMAYYLLQTDRRREALWAVAAAQSLETEDRESLRRNPFAGALLERSLESAKKRPSSRIIQPFAHRPSSGERSLII